MDVGTDTPTSQSFTSNFIPHLSSSVEATAIPTESQTGPAAPSNASSMDHAEDVNSTAAHPWATSVSRREGSTSVEFGNTEEHQAGLSTTKASELSHTSQLTAKYQTSTYRLGADPTTSDHEEGSGHELATGEPTLGEEITVLSVKPQTSHWELLHTTDTPQESLDDLEYTKVPSSNSSAVAPGSTAESDVSRTEPTAATTTSSVKSTSHTWSPTTSKPPGFHEAADPRSALTMPPVNQGRVDPDFSFTQPPTLLILPNERAAVGGTGKASGNVKATLISLTVVLLLLDAMMH